MTKNVLEKNADNNISSQLSGFFKKKEEEKPQASIADVLSALRDFSRRIRIVEERYTNIRKNIQVNEQNMLKDSKENALEIKALNAEIREQKKSIRSIGEDMKQVIKELKECVKKEDVRILERYINIWQPMNYVTHNEMDKRIKELLKEELKLKAEQKKHSGQE